MTKKANTPKPKNYKNVAIPVETWKALKLKAVERDATLSDLIAELVAKHLK